MEAEPLKADPPKRKRRWYQFSLRTLLIFTLICVIGAHRSGASDFAEKEGREAVAAIVKVGGDVKYDYELVQGEATGPAWLRRLFGDDFFSDVIEVRVSTNEDAEPWLANVHTVVFGRPDR